MPSTSWLSTTAAKPWLKARATRQKRASRCGKLSSVLRNNPWMPDYPPHLSRTGDARHRPSAPQVSITRPPLPCFTNPPPNPLVMPSKVEASLDYPTSGSSAARDRMWAWHTPRQVEGGPRDPSTRRRLAALVAPARDDEKLVQGEHRFSMRSPRWGDHTCLVWAMTGRSCGRSSPIDATLPGRMWRTFVSWMRIQSREHCTCG